MKHDLVHNCALCGAPFKQLWEEILRWGGTLEDARTNIHSVDDYKRVRCSCTGRASKA